MNQKNKTKIVHFNRFNQATLNLEKRFKSDAEYVTERLTKSDSDIELVAPRIRNVLNRIRGVKAIAGADLADAQKMRAYRLAAPQHQSFAPMAPIRIVVKIIKTLAVLTFVPKAVAKAPNAPDFAVAIEENATSGVAAALAGADGPRRVCAISNKRQAPCRFIPSFSSSVTITSKLLMLFFLLFLAAATNAQDVIVLPELATVAEN